MASDVEIARRLYAEMGRGDFSSTVRFFAPDVRFERFGAELLSGEVRGLEAFGAAIREWLQAFERLRIVAEEFLPVDDRVLVLVRHQGTARGSGLPFEQEIGDLLTLRDGLVTVYHSYWNREDALATVGLGG